MNMSKEEALETVLNDPENGRYAHFSQYPPMINIEKSNGKTPSTQISHDNISIPQIPANLFSDQESNSDSDGQDNHEFLLAVEDLQSAISQKESEHEYSIRQEPKSKAKRNLDQMFTKYEEGQQFKRTGNKRVKISESTEISYPLYDTQDLKKYSQNRDKIYLLTDLSKRVRYVSKSSTKLSNLDMFESLDKILEDLAYQHYKTIEEVHMMFLEVSCDLGLLKAYLNRK